MSSILGGGTGGTVPEPTPSAPTNYIAPVIFGTPEVGNTLVANSGSWGGYPFPGIVREWLRDGASTGVTGLEYPLMSGDAGKTITFKETAKNASGTVTKVSNAATIGMPSEGTPGVMELLYDRHFGTGEIDSDGMAVFAQPVDAKCIFVRSALNGGNDANSGLDPAHPVATIAKGASLVTSGKGDYVLLAEGDVWDEFFPWLGVDQLKGKDETAPTIFQSYDASDPLNAAKYGKGHQRTRPKLTKLQQTSNGYGPKNLAFRGLEFNPGNIANQGMGFLASPLDPGNAEIDAGCYNILFENNVCRYAGISFDLGGYPANTGPNTSNVDKYPSHHICVRGNSFYAMWSDADDGRTGGLYAAGARYFTNEYNVFYHNGWRDYPGITRDDAASVGGATVFSHSWYHQMNSDDNIIRGNLTSEGGGDAGTLRGSGIWHGVISIRSPNVLSLGGGSPYGGATAGRPAGTYIDAAYNVGLNAVNQRSDHNLGWGMTASNGLPGRLNVHHNVLVQSDIRLSSTSANFIGISGGFPQPSYALFHHNVGYKWVDPTNGNAVSNFTKAIGWLRGRQVHNVWDAPTGDSNVNSNTVTFPNPLTEQQGYAALGFADFKSFITHCVDHPEQKKWLQLRDMFLEGYGVSLTPPTDQTAPVLSNVTVTSTGATSAAIGVTTTEGNGRLYWVRTASSVSPIRENIMIGFNEDPLGVDAIASGVVTVTSPGVQTLNLTIPDPGDYYVHLCHEDAECNPSAAISSAVVHIAGNPTAFSTDPNLTSSDWTIVDQGAGKQKLTKTTLSGYWSRARSNQPKLNSEVIVDIIANPEATFGGLMLGWDNGDVALNGDFLGKSDNGSDVGVFSATDGPVFVTGGAIGNLSTPPLGTGRYKFTKAAKVYSVHRWSGSSWDLLWTFDFATWNGMGVPGTYTIPIMEACYFAIVVGNATGHEVVVDWTNA